MTVVVSPRRCLAAGRALLLLLAATSLPAAAQSMACGVYAQDEDRKSVV